MALPPVLESEGFGIAAMLQDKEEEEKFPRKETTNGDQSMPRDETQEGKNDQTIVSRL